MAEVAWDIREVSGSVGVLAFPPLRFAILVLQGVAGFSILHSGCQPAAR